MQTDNPEVGFLGSPIQTDLARLEADVAILGIPHGWPYPRPGCHGGLRPGSDSRAPPRAAHGAIP